MLPLNIFFSSAVFTPPKFPAITFTPINPSWDDFSHNYRAQVSVFLSDSNDDPCWTSTAFVVPLNDWEPLRKLSSWIGSLPLVDDPKSKIRTIESRNSANPYYVTLLGSESGYSSLSQHFSDRKTIDEILTALNDVLFIQHSLSKYNERLNDLVRSKSFSLGVLRDSSAFRAFHRGAIFITSPPREYIDEAKKNFNFSCALQRHGKVSEINLSFQYGISTILEDRIHCLIGVNGTGKSRILNEIILEAARRIAGEKSLGRDAHVSPSEVNSDMPLYNRVIVFSSDAEDRFPRNVDASLGFEYIYFNLIESERKKSNRSLVKDLIGIVREELEIDGMSRLSIAKKALCGYVEFNDIYIPMREDAEDIPTTFSKSPDGKLWIAASLLTSCGEQRRLELTSKVDASRELIVRSGSNWDSQLSSGQRVYLRFILQLLGSIDTGTLVIMDEPENHLHPSLVCDLMTLLYKALLNTQSIALIATHSAYVVREVPTHCVHILRENNDDDIDVQNVYLKTLGANISQISMAVFGDSTARKYHQLIASQIAKNDPDIDSIIEKHSEDLNSEMLSAIRIAIEGGGFENDWDF